MQLTHQVDIDKYYVKLPKNNVELFSWADTLHNCLASFEDEIYSHRTTVYGFFQDSKLIFTVEIQNASITQAYKKYNTPLSSNERKILNNWLDDSKERVRLNLDT